MDAVLTMLAAAGVNYIMGVPGSDDIMLNYQSSSFHDALYLRSFLNLRPAPEIERWLEQKLPGFPEFSALLEAMKDLRTYTPARVSLGTAGDHLPTAPLLALRLAHAKARDAVQLSFDTTTLRGQMDAPRLAFVTAEKRGEDERGVPAAA